MRVTWGGGTGERPFGRSPSILEGEYRAERKKKGGKEKRGLVYHYFRSPLILLRGSAAKVGFYYLVYWFES